MERTQNSEKCQNDCNRKQTNIEFLRTIDSRFHFNQLIFADSVFIITTTFNTIANYHDNALHLMISTIITKKDRNKKEFFLKINQKTLSKALKY